MMTKKKDNLITDNVEHFRSLKRKAKKMGLIKGEQKLCRSHLDKLYKAGGVWIKRVEETRDCIKQNKKQVEMYQILTLEELF